MIELELNFVSDYYHSVVPLVLSSPWFFVGNYLFVILIVVNQSIMVLFITGNGRLLPVIGCLARYLAMMSHRAIDLFKCLGHKLLKTIIIAFSSLIILAFLLMEAWEFVVYVLSDWFLVSLLCEYARRPKWQASRCVRRAFGALLWVKRLGRQARPRAAGNGLRFNQVCVLDLRRHTPWMTVSKLLQHRFLGMPSVPVPGEVKHAVFAAVAGFCKDDGHRRRRRLSNGVAVLHRRGWTQLLWACESSSVTEVILVWHIATSLFEMKKKKNQDSKAPPSAEETVATPLSKYCAYLVACAPELLPEDLDGSERAYKAVKRDIRGALSKERQRSRLDRVVEMRGPEAAANIARGWALLAELWAELAAYVAPSDNIEGHAEALAQGGEFITLLWALSTHAGITRW